MFKEVCISLGKNRQVLYKQLIPFVGTWCLKYILLPGQHVCSQCSHCCCHTTGKPQTGNISQPPLSTILQPLIVEFLSILSSCAAHKDRIRKFKTFTKYFCHSV